MESNEESKRWRPGWKVIARQFSVSVRTVQRWHRMMSMPVIKIGRMIYSRATEIEGWAKRFAATSL